MSTIRCPMCDCDIHDCQCEDRYGASDTECNKAEKLKQLNDALMFIRCNMQDARMDVHNQLYECVQKILPLAEDSELCAILRDTAEKLKSYHGGEQ